MPSIPFSNLTLNLLSGIIIYLIWQLNFFSLLPMGFSLQISLVESLVNMGVLVLANFAIMQIFRYYHPPASQFWIILSVAAVFAILLVILAKLLIPFFIPNNNDYANFLNRSTGIRMGFAVLAICFLTILNLLWNMLGQEMQAGNRKQEMQSLAREAELFKLRQQLQPHFLFNSLNSINALVSSRPKEARQMIEQLSVFLRATINRKEGETIPLTEEMEQIDRYLQIEKFRFGHRLKTAIAIPESCADAKLPPLLLQPIVENAIKFGLYDTTEEVVISIHAHCTGPELILTVTNPFDAASGLGKKGTGFGLSAVQRRLYLLFGRQDLLSTSHDGNYFITTISIPQQYADSNDH